MVTASGRFGQGTAPSARVGCTPPDCPEVCRARAVLLSPTSSAAARSSMASARVSSTSRTSLRLPRRDHVCRSGRARAGDRASDGAPRHTGGGAGRDGDAQLGAPARRHLRGMRLRPHPGAGSTSGSPRCAEVAYIVEQSGARVLFVDPELRDDLAGVPCEHTFVLGEDEHLFADSGGERRRGRRPMRTPRRRSTTPPGRPRAPRACS